jgi:hypothetical protein
LKYLISWKTEHWLMKINQFRIICMVSLVALLAVSGCVAPPEASTTGPVDLYDPNQFAQVTAGGSDPGLLAQATPFQTTAVQTQGYSVIEPPTQIPEDMVCLIFFSDYAWTLESNRTAKNFNLLNPPMYINYSITEPFNVTGTKIVTEKGKEKTVKYSYYSPYAFLEITVRDPVTGEIFQQDGFGKDYGSMTNKTIQITKPGNLLIEIGGNNVTPSVGFWVKPVGNINDPAVNVSALECRSQDYVKRLHQ